MNLTMKSYGVGRLFVGSLFWNTKREVFLNHLCFWTQMKFNIVTYIILAFLKNVSDKIL